MTELKMPAADVPAHPVEVETVPLQYESSPVDLVAVFATLKAGRRFIFITAFACFCVAALVAFLLPNLYSSAASFIPPSTSTSSAAAIASQLSSLGASSLLGGVKSSGDLYAGILRSRSIGTELVDRFDLKKVYRAKYEIDAIKHLASSTAIEVGVKDPIVTITVTDRSQTRARDMANAYLNALVETNGRLALTESSQRRLFFDRQLASEKNALADAEVDLKKTEEQSGLIAPGGQTTVQIQTIAQTRAQIAARQVELAGLRQSLADQNPSVIQLSSEIADLQGQLARLQKGSGTDESGSIPVSKVPELQLDFVRKEREVKYHTALFDILAKQDEAARLDEAREAPLLQILDSASYPEEKSSPHRTLIALGGLLIGGLLGCAWVVCRKYLQPMKSMFASLDSIKAADGR